MYSFTYLFTYCINNLHSDALAASQNCK